MEIQSWSCSICIQSIFPFSNLNDTELYKQLHSLNDTNLNEIKLNNLKEKLAFLSYTLLTITQIRMMMKTLPFL